MDFSGRGYEVKLQPDNSDQLLWDFFDEERRKTYKDADGPKYMSATAHTWVVADTHPAQNGYVEALNIPYSLVKADWMVGALMWTGLFFTIATLGALIALNR